MRAVVVLVSFLLVGPVWTHGQDRLETVLAVTQCRASCLHQFGHNARTEDNCQKTSDCFMCWEMCKMLNENFLLWNPMCSVADICIPGCKKACDSMENRNFSNNSISRTALLRSVYEPHTDHVRLEWVPDPELENDSVILYAILLKNLNQAWYEIAQTTSHILHIKRGLLSGNTSIRLIAANATHKIYDTETSYWDSYFTDSAAETTEISSWKPRLESMIQSETSIGLLTTITWPVPADKPTKYEVSWNVIDDSMEITGHLYTSKNAAVLTLWPESLYSIQVICYKSDEVLHSQSEPLIIDTRNSYQEPSTSRVICKPGEDFTSQAYLLLAAMFSAVFLMLAIIWILKHKVGNITGTKDSLNEELNDKHNPLHLQMTLDSKTNESQVDAKMKRKEIERNLNFHTSDKLEVFHIV